MQELRELARRLLDEKTVGVVIGYEEGPRGLRPVFITDPADAERLVFDHRAVHNLATYLNPRRRHLAPFGKPAVVVKTCDARAVAGLIRETQIKREDVVLIGVRCGGVARSADAGGPLDAATLADRCVVCDEPAPHLADFVVGPAAQHPQAAARRAERIAEIDALSPAERWEFWREELAKCVRCHACREVCPMCFCERCAADKSQPQWIETSPHGRGNLAWQINRALHLAGRCVGCDECERVCPVAIPLGLITRKMAQVCEQRFAHRAVDDPAVPAPIGVYRSDDAQEFIR